MHGQSVLLFFFLVAAVDTCPETVHLECLKSFKVRRFFVTPAPQDQWLFPHCSKLGYLVYILILRNSFIECEAPEGIDGRLIRDRMVFFVDYCKKRRKL